MKESSDSTRPASPASVEHRARELQNRDIPFARATVVRREPPISARVGDRALVTREGDLIGWVGGNECAQSIVVREGVRSLRTETGILIGLAPEPESIQRPGMETFPMACHSGGTLEIFIEPVLPLTPLLLVGRSPVVETLARLAGQLSFEITVVDPGGEEYPGAQNVLTSTEPDEIAGELRRGAYVVVATMGEYDARGVAAGIQIEASYLGLVASRKRERKVLERAAGLLDVDPETIRERIVSPAGLKLNARTPEDIAVSILAELVQHRARERNPKSGESGEGPGIRDEQQLEPVEDPVCGMEVSRQDPPFRLTHEGQEYFFCSQDCVDSFRLDPGQYT